MPDNNGKRIARNTIFLYFRMMLIMVVTLYTSRVTLSVLGEDDFGLYQIVGGVVTFFTFLSNALGSGTSRFITYEMGKENPKLQNLFATVRVAHIVLGIFIVVLCEVIGLWIIYNKLVIPADRMNAAVFAFHFSMLATFFQITQVPYHATIIAYEKMNLYAYISILEACLKLAVVYALNLFKSDKLEVYAVLMFATTFLIMFAYRTYCRKSFNEIRGKLHFDKKMFMGVASFSGWNLLSSSAASLANQGVTVVTNMFFPPSVITVRTLALRINNVINNFIGSFRTAVNPQIVKKYAAKDYDGSKQLALESTKYTYYLMLILVIPLFLLTEPALRIWLEEVPNGLILFVQITLFQGLFQALDTSLYVPIYAKGRIKENAIISPLFDFMQLPVIFYLFKNKYPPITLAWVEFTASLMLGIVIKPILVHKIVGYRYLEVMSLLGRCAMVTGLSVILPIISANLFDANTIMGFLIITIVSVMSVGGVIWFVGINRDGRRLLKNWIISILSERKGLNS